MTTIKICIRVGPPTSMLDGTIWLLKWASNLTQTLWSMVEVRVTTKELKPEDLAPMTTELKLGVLGFQSQVTR